MKESVKLVDSSSVEDIRKMDGMLDDQDHRDKQRCFNGSDNRDHGWMIGSVSCLASVRFFLRGKTFKRPLEIHSMNDSTRGRRHGTLQTIGRNCI